MLISFPADPLPQVNRRVLSFYVLVDSVDIVCEISFEALEDHFGVNTRSGQSVVDAFHAHREEFASLVGHTVSHRLHGRRCQIFSRDIVYARAERHA
ncbi:DUF1488 family protein [Paraburkholderia tropica]|uniref:DUF1488 family protein n=1 Tax=Paraburkholderia tropica TaxID=92647 RepID=UPI001CC488E1